VIEIENCADSTVVCRPSGDLDFISSMELRHVLSDLFRPDITLVIDLRSVDMIDAVGVSALVGSVRRVRAHGGRAHVCNANPRISWFFRLLDVDRLVGPLTATTRPGVT
jgi:anti-anti-sigma factor